MDLIKGSVLREEGVSGQGKRNHLGSFLQFVVMLWSLRKVWEIFFPVMAYVEVIYKIRTYEVESFVQICTLPGRWQFGVICPSVDFHLLLLCSVLAIMGGPLKCGRNNKHLKPSDYLRIVQYRKFSTCRHMEM